MFRKSVLESDRFLLCDDFTSTFVGEFRAEEKNCIQGSSRTITDARVAIVGAGLAGLSAARYLEERGVDYVIFEGTDRVGGRVYPAPYKDGFIQYGAEFINGQKNPIYEIAARLGIVKRYANDEELFEDADVVYASGPLSVSKSDIEEFKKFTAPLQDLYETESISNPTATVGHRFQRDYERWIVEDINRITKRDVFDSLAAMYCTYYENEWSAPCDQLAFQNLDRWDDYSDAFASFTLDKYGFKAILDEVTKPVKMEKIRYNAVVKNIDYEGTKCRISLDSTPVPDLFDFVIVTTSVGHLQRFHHILFNPPLPRSKVRAIESIGMGNMMKVFLEYEKPFWNDRISSILALPYRTPQGKEEQSKTDRIMQAMRVFQPLEWQDNTLVLWIAGDGPALIATLPDSLLSELITVRLRDSLNDSTISYPIGLKRHDWYSNPLFLGSYSFLTPEAAAQGDVYERMADPVFNNATGKPQILFAGEATHSNLYQTTSGAYLSGQREAERICKLEGRI